MSCAFERYLGIDYSGAKTANSGLSALRVYESSPGKEATEIRATGGPKIHWTRRGIAEWLVEKLSEEQPTLIGHRLRLFVSTEVFSEIRLAPQLVLVSRRFSKALADRRGQHLRRFRT